MNASDDHPSIHPETEVGAVRLTVADLDRARAFYEDVVGLRALEPSEEAVRLGSDGAGPLIELVGSPGAVPRPRGTAGLFHLAILLPSRLELARALRRVATAGWRLAGASDHLVSEALYLSDPEGNGIEIYRDRPREEWPYRDGKLRMATLPLDLDGLLADAPAGDADAGSMPPAARIGHVHLNVGDLGAAETFYGGVLGLEVTVRDYPGALFLSAGGYHHHVGLNTWAGEGAPPPPPGALGLRWFEVVLPRPGELDALDQRMVAAGVDVEREGGALRVADPSGNGLLLRSRASA